MSDHVKNCKQDYEEASYRRDHYLERWETAKEHASEQRWDALKLFAKTFAHTWMQYYVIAIFLYGFGKLLDKVSLNYTETRRTNKLLTHMRDERQRSAHRVLPQGDGRGDVPRNEGVTGKSWIFPSCGSKNAGRDMYWKDCGKYR